MGHSALSLNISPAQQPCQRSSARLLAKYLENLAIYTLLINNSQDESLFSLDFKEDIHRVIHTVNRAGGDAPFILN
jgi:hypothetical protein